MNLFELAFRITHYRRPEDWVETKAVFTGKSRQAVILTRSGSKPAPYNAYELIYQANGRQRHEWYSFHPLPDPDPEDLKNRTMWIRYKKRRPYIFEYLSEEEKSVRQE